jgi:hypothetical protein
VTGSIRRSPAAAQHLGGLVGVGVEELLELFGGEGADCQAVALVEGRAQRLQVVLILVGVGVGVGVGVLAHGLLPSASF